MDELTPLETVTAALADGKDCDRPALGAVLGDHDTRLDALAARLDALETPTTTDAAPAAE